MTILEKLQQFASWLSDLFNKIPAHIKEYAEAAIAITKQVQDGLNSGTAIIITELIPGEWDDNLRTEANSILTFLLEVLKAIDNIGSAENKVATDAIYAKMASALIGIQDKKELPENKYDLYMQSIYSKSKLTD